VFADDFAIDRAGRIYATTHAYDSIVRIGADRRPVVIGEYAQGLQGATALAFASDKQGALVAVTNGGVYVPPARGIEDAKVVRIDLATRR
jgi:hypothetical protein